MREDNITTLRQSVFGYVRSKYSVEPDYPWQNDLQSAVLRHKDNKRWFALIMRLPAKRLGLNGNEELDVINLKADPIRY